MLDLDTRGLFKLLGVHVNSFLLFLYVKYFIPDVVSPEFKTVKTVFSNFEKDEIFM